MDTEGIVRRFDADNGTGVIDSAATPGGCFVHFSVIATSGYAVLTPGQRVRFGFEAVPQDDLPYRATAVSDEPAVPGSDRARDDDTHRTGRSVAYRSTLTVEGRREQGRATS